MAMSHVGSAALRAGAPWPLLQEAPAGHGLTYAAPAVGARGTFRVSRREGGGECGRHCRSEKALVREGDVRVFGNPSWKLRREGEGVRGRRKAGLLWCSVRNSISKETELAVEEVKASLFSELEGVNRGIFGVTSVKKLQIENLIRELEALNALQEPTKHLDQVDGKWRLLYSTISILGPRRTKLGLREFVKLGEFRQIIDTAQSRAVNEVDFHVMGLGVLGGSFTVEASYSVLSPERVGIKFERSTIVPTQLLNLFEKNYDLLLSIFNPEGWLDITYVDDAVRIGRDNKGNVFLVERIE